MPDADEAVEAVEARAWVATAHGDPTKVMEQRTISVPAPGPNEVRVEVRAFCLNFNDIDIIRGRYATLMLEPPFTPGMEAVGAVESAGPGAEHLLGRRIVGIPVMAHGGYASHVVVDAATALELPDWVDDADGPPSTTRSTSAGSPCTSGRGCSRARRCSCTQPPAAPARARCRSAKRSAPR